MQLVFHKLPVKYDKWRLASKINVQKNCKVNSVPPSPSQFNGSAICTVHSSEPFNISKDINNTWNYCLGSDFFLLLKICTVTWTNFFFTWKSIWDSLQTLPNKGHCHLFRRLKVAKFLCRKGFIYTEQKEIKRSHTKGGRFTVNAILDVLDISTLHCKYYCVNAFHFKMRRKKIESLIRHLFIVWTDPTHVQTHGRTLLENWLDKKVPRKWIRNAIELSSLAYTII